MIGSYTLCYKGEAPLRESLTRDHELVSPRFANPKYWPTWAGLALLRGIGFLPFWAQCRLGRELGKLIGLLPLAYLRIARCNMALCLPKLSECERSDLLSQHCRSLGMGVCETAVTWWGSDAKIKRLAQVHGAEHLHAALARGRGAIIIGGHFTTIEIATRILGTVVPLNALYRPPKNQLLGRVMRANFCRYGKPIAHDDIRSMIRALKGNEAVWYAPDQSYRNKGAAMIDFFGIPAATTTATTRLAKISGAAVLTYFVERLPGRAGYRATISPILENFPGADARCDVQRFNRMLEAHIMKVPDQYLWMHRRFKGLSSEYPNYYGRDARRRTAGAHTSAP
jgi:Kdo2-lipid IVA lauroyltransferase/acyltransferase